MNTFHQDIALFHEWGYRIDWIGGQRLGNRHTTVISFRVSQNFHLFRHA